jgi:hypothetical protein
MLPHWMTKGSWESRHPNLNGTFDAEDEQLFVGSFLLELVHPGLFKQAVETSGDQSDDVHIRSRFSKTEFFTQPTFRYALYVEMQIEDPVVEEWLRQSQAMRKRANLRDGDE